MPAAFRSIVEPLIPAIVKAVHESFAIAIASTFWNSIGAALLAALFVLFLRERPLGQMAEPEDEPAEAQTAVEAA